MLLLQGGLTTPTCDQVVLWTNFLSTVKVSEGQLSLLRAMVDTDGVTLNDNFRPPQPLHGRAVYTTKVTKHCRVKVASHRLFPGSRN